MLVIQRNEVPIGTLQYFYIIVDDLNVSITIKSKRLLKMEHINEVKLRKES